MTYLPDTPPPKPANSAARSWGSSGQRQPSDTARRRGHGRNGPLPRWLLVGLRHGRAGLPQPQDRRKPKCAAAPSWASARTCSKPAPTPGRPGRVGRLFTSAADVHRRAWGRYQRVEERGDVGRDPHTAMGRRPAWHVGVPVDREGGADEEHGVVHPAERRCHPAWHERKGGEVAGRRDGVAAAVRRAEVVPAAGGYVADQRDM